VREASSIPVPNLWEDILLHDQDALLSASTLARYLDEVATSRVEWMSKSAIAHPFDVGTLVTLLYSHLSSDVKTVDRF